MQGRPTGRPTPERAFRFRVHLVRLRHAAKVFQGSARLLTSPLRDLQCLNLSSQLYLDEAAIRQKCVGKEQCKKRTWERRTKRPPWKRRAKRAPWQSRRAKRVPGGRGEEKEGNDDDVFPARTARTHDDDVFHS